MNEHCQQHKKRQVSLCACELMLLWYCNLLISKSLDFQDVNNEFGRQKNIE